MANLEQVTHKVWVEKIVACLGWFYSYEEVSFATLEDFIKSISVEEPDPGLVREIFERYCQSIHATGFELEKRGKEEI